MIRKPPGAEQESKTHEVVGRAIEIGGEVRDASKKGSQLLGKGCFLYFAIAMAFGLLVSSTPLWFKALVAVLGYGAYRLIRGAAYRWNSISEDSAEPSSTLQRIASSLGAGHDGPAF